MVEIYSTTADASVELAFANTSARWRMGKIITAIATNAKGESSESARFTPTIDTPSPDAPRVELIADNTGLLTGRYRINDRLTRQNRYFPGRRGGSNTTIKEGSTVIGSATVDGEMDADFTPDYAVADGEHYLTVEQKRQSRKHEPRDDNAYYHRITTPPTPLAY